MRLVHRDDRGAVWKNRGEGNALLVDNEQAFTLRGIHWQDEPAGRSKLFTVIKGSVHFVQIDLVSLRVYPAHLQPGQSMFIERDHACGYMTIRPGTIVHYEMDGPQSREHERGIRWDDPFFSIDWKAVPAVISERDRTWPDFSPQGSR